MPAALRRHWKLCTAGLLLAAGVVWACLVETPPLAHEDYRFGLDAAGAGDLAGPVPYPAPTEGLVQQPRTFPLEQILEHKALKSYSQPAWLDPRVAAGKLPPVEQRLPEEPQVMRTAAMSDGPGEYGGVWRDVYASPTEGWNWGAGQSQGYFGLNAIVQESLVRSAPIYRRADRPEPLPNLARSWQWSADGRTLTMALIRGARWSDGHPFTAADVLFTWHDLILDAKVRHHASRSTWQINGEDVRLERIDDYTIRWTFPVPRPVQLLFKMDEGDFSVSPAHVLKPHHPRHNAKANYVRFENCLPPQSLPPVVLGPWVPVQYKTDELLVMRRNPYYWKVDERGRQLPYLDEVVFERANTGVQRTYRTLAGAGDHTNLENPSSFIEVTKRLQDPRAHFGVKWGPETLGFSMLVNQSANLGVRTTRDAELRRLFRDVRFRRALSQAIDRRGLCDVLVRGPFLRPWPGGLFPGSPYFDARSVVHYPFSPPSTRRLLGELGFRDTDGDGVLNWTRGPLAGQNLVLALYTGEIPACLTLSEAMVALLAEVGIKINLRRLESTGFRAATENGTWELIMTRDGQAYAVPFTRAEELAPITRETPSWHREGNRPRRLQPFEAEIVDVVRRFRTEPDPARRKALMARYNRLFTENVYSIGLVIGRYGLALAKRFRNVPDGAPVFLYQWTWDNVVPEQIWVRPADRIPEIRRGVVPLYGAGGRP
jgi:peptide/nickel transport system substrate-binding protein